MAKKQTEKTVKILHTMRKQIDARIQHQRVVSYTLLGLLIIQFIFFSMVRRFDFMGTLGIIISFIWCLWAVQSILKLKKEQLEIDTFYLINVNGDSYEKK